MTPAGPSRPSRRLRRPLFLKFFLAFLLAAVLSVVPLGVFLSLRLRDLLEDETVRRQREELTLLAHALVASWPAAGGADPSRVDALVDDLARDLSGRVTVIAPDGRVLGDSEVSGAALLAMENHALRPEVEAAAARGEGVDRRRSTSVGETFLYRARPLRDAASRPLGFVRLAFPLGRVEAELTRAVGLLIVGLGLALGLAATLAALLAHRLARPIERLRLAADEMARGDLGEEVRLGTGDELEELAGSLNRMSRELAAQRAALVAEKEQLLGVLQGMVEGVLVTDRGGRIVQANEALQQMFNLGRPPVGKTSLEALRNPALEELLHRALTTHERTAGLVHLARPVERQLQVGVAPLGKNGSIQGAVAVFHDVTRLARLEAVRRDFVANVSHEIRTPVTAIRGYAETLRDAAESPEERARFVQIIVRHADRLTRLVDDLLALSALESAGEVLRLEHVPIADLLAAVEEAFRPRAAEKGVTLTMGWVDPDLALRGDRGLLEQLLGNLVDNAVKYTEGGGSVTVEASAEADRVTLHVTDTGSGIPASDLDRVFERFFRVDRARSRKLGGTGLGLAIVKHIVMLHGGKVGVRSRPGEGSEFTVTLPVAGPPAGARESRASRV